MSCLQRGVTTMMANLNQGIKRIEDNSSIRNSNIICSLPAMAQDWSLRLTFGTQYTAGSRKGAATAS